MHPSHFLASIFSVSLFASICQCSVTKCLCSFFITLPISKLLSFLKMIYSFFLLSVDILSLLHIIAFWFGSAIRYSSFRVLNIVQSRTLSSIRLNQSGLRPLLLQSLICLTCCHVRSLSPLLVISYSSVKIHILLLSLYLLASFSSNKLEILVPDISKFSS